MRALTLFLAAIGIAVAPASAGGLWREHVYADSFGNLIVYSPSGYKRVVVGAGELAAELRDYGSGRAAGRHRARAPEAAYSYRECSEAGVRLHGRSYMYGLPENVVPVLDSCG